MISDHFVADPALLGHFAAIHPDAPWERAITLMQVLQEKGFDAPKSEDDDFPTDPSEAAEFTQAWRHNPQEGAMAYFARSRQATVAMATLTWAVGVNLSSSQAVSAVKLALADLSHVLGPVHAVLDQSAAWVKDGEAGSGDEVAVSACWSREPIATSVHTLSVSEYQTAQRALQAPIGFSVVLEKNASKLWNVIGTLIT